MAVFEMLLKPIKQMSSNKDEIVKGIKFLAIALPLMILGPVVLTIGFRAINDGNYIWLVLGCTIILIAIIVAFKGIKTILNGLFNKNES